MTPNPRFAAAAAFTITATALICAPVAAATAESQFLDELGTINALLPGKTPDENVAAGYAACAELKSGTSVLDEMAAVETKYRFSQGTLFVSAATTNLCPNFASG